MSHSDYKNISEGYLDNTRIPRYERFIDFKGLDFGALNTSFNIGNGISNLTNSIQNMNITQENVTVPFTNPLLNYNSIKKTSISKTMLDAAKVARDYAKNNSIDFYEYHFDKQYYQPTIVINTYKDDKDDPINTQYYLKTLDDITNNNNILKLNNQNKQTTKNPSITFDLKIKHQKNGESIGWYNFNPSGQIKSGEKYIYKKHPGRKGDFVNGYSELYIELQADPRDTVTYSTIKLCAENNTMVGFTPTKKEICIFISFS